MGLELQFCIRLFQAVERLGHEAVMMCTTHSGGGGSVMIGSMSILFSKGEIAFDTQHDDDNCLFKLNDRATVQMLVASMLRQEADIELPADWLLTPAAPPATVPKED